MPLRKTGSKARFRHETVKPKGRFDPRSFRTKKVGASRVIIGCPKGKHSPSKGICKVGTQAQAILRPLKRNYFSVKRFGKTYLATDSSGQLVTFIKRSDAISFVKKYKERGVNAKVEKGGVGLYFIRIDGNKNSPKRNWKPIKRSQRNLIIDRIIAEVYENGRITKKALELYIDNRISKKTFDDVCRLAMKMRGKATKNVKKNVKRLVNSPVMMRNAKMSNKKEIEKAGKKFIWFIQKGWDTELAFDVVYDTVYDLIGKKDFLNYCQSLVKKMKKKGVPLLKRNVKKKTNPRKKWYFGPSVQHRGKILVFSSARNPSKKTHGKYIRNAVGPYASKVTAMNAAKKCMN